MRDSITPFLLFSCHAFAQPIIGVYCQGTRLARAKHPHRSPSAGKFVMSPRIFQERFVGVVERPRTLVQSFGSYQLSTPKPYESRSPETSELGIETPSKQLIVPRCLRTCFSFCYRYHSTRSKMPSALASWNDNDCSNDVQELGHIGVY